MGLCCRRGVLRARLLLARILSMLAGRLLLRVGLPLLSVLMLAVLMLAMLMLAMLLLAAVIALSTLTAVAAATSPAAAAPSTAFMLRVAGLSMNHRFDVLERNGSSRRADLQQSAYDLAGTARCGFIGGQIIGARLR